MVEQSTLVERLMVRIHLAARGIGKTLRSRKQSVSSACGIGCGLLAGFHQPPPGSVVEWQHTSRDQGGDTGSIPVRTTESAVLQFPAQVATVVEHSSLAGGVAGSIPALRSLLWLASGRKRECYLPLGGAGLKVNTFKPTHFASHACPSTYFHESSWM